jgi:hypothetical protein
MTRSIDPLFDPRLADWLEEDDSTAPEQALEIVLASFPSIKQRRAVRVPWRTTSMSSTLRLGLAAAVVVAAAIGSIYFLGSRSNSPVAGPETQSPSVSPSEAPSNGAPAGTLSTFSSPQYGYSVEYPTPYAAVPATEPWPDDGQLGPEEPWVDRFFAPNSTTFVGIAAMPKPEGATDEEFAAAYQQLVAERGCPVPLDAWSDATVGDQPARRAEFECGGARAVELIWIDGDTGYVITGEPEVVDLMAESFTRD